MNPAKISHQPCILPVESKPKMEFAKPYSSNKLAHTLLLSKCIPNPRPAIRPVYAAVVSGYGGAYPLPPTCFIGSRQVRSCLCWPLAGASVSTGPPSIAAIGQEPTRVSYSLPFSPPRAFYPSHVPSSTLAPTGPDKNDQEKAPEHIGSGALYAFGNKVNAC